MPLTVNGYRCFGIDFQMGKRMSHRPSDFILANLLALVAFQVTIIEAEIQNFVDLADRWVLKPGATLNWRYQSKVFRINFARF